MMVLQTTNIDSVPREMLVDGLADIAGLCINYDGFDDVEGLKSLVDDIALIAHLVADGRYDDRHRFMRP